MRKDPLSLFNIKGKTIILTGSSGFLGTQYAHALSKLHANLILVDYENKKNKRLEVDLKKRYKTKPMSFDIDISDQESVKELTRKVLKKYKKIDILINNATTNPRKHPKYSAKFESYPLDLWQKYVDVNLTGLFLCSQEIGNIMAKQRNGVIVNVSSIYGNIGTDQRIYGKKDMNTPVAYAATKGAFLNFTRYTAAYWQKKNVRVNTLSLGGVFKNQDKEFVKNYKKIGFSGLIGGLGLATAMITFIWSITNTTAAITLLCLAAMPFITALLGFLFLKEEISLNVWIAIFIASIGILIMALNNNENNSLVGLVLGLASAVGFSVFSVSLRWRKETPKFTTVALAGLFCFLISSAVLFSNNMNFLSSSKNESLFALHGTIVCLGLILYSIASKNIPAAELTLLSLTEVIGGVFWVWLPWLGINEVPSTNTIIGGFLIFLSIMYYSLLIKNNRRFIALN